MSIGSYEELQTFVAVVERAGLTPCEQFLGLSRSAISRRLDALETRLGVRLLERTSKSVVPTHAGEIFLRRCKVILNELDEAVIELAGYQVAPVGVLRVTAPVIIGSYKLIPILKNFMKRNEQIKVHLDLTDDNNDPLLDNHDIGVRWSYQASSSLIQTRIGSSRQIVCASTDFLQRHGVPQRPEDLVDFDCILQRRLGKLSNEWTFNVNGVLTAVKVRGNFLVNNGSANFEALCAGLGIGRVTEFCAQTQLESGRLVPLLVHWEPKEATPIYLTYKAGKISQPAVRLFVAFLKESFTVSVIR